MNGCKSCPAYDKCTIQLVGYRGSTCAALRFTCGLDSDPEIITNYDRIEAMSVEEMAEFLTVTSLSMMSPEVAKALKNNRVAQMENMLQQEATQ